MCRWLAYSGSPIRIEELLLKRDRSLIDQSLHSRLGATTTNGDGFGLGWYDDADGRNLWALRYLSEGASRSLYFSTRMDALRALHPEVEGLAELTDETRVVVSEPLGDELPGAWNEVPESSWGVIKPGDDEIHAFEPVGASA